MRYAIVTVTDGNFIVRSEWNDAEAAIKAFHNLAASLWNDTSFSNGYIAIFDENLDAYSGYKEYITHATPAPVEPTEE